MHDKTTVSRLNKNCPNYQRSSPVLLGQNILYLWHKTNVDSNIFKIVTRISHCLVHINSIKTYDFSTLYTTIQHTKLKARLKSLINQCFLYKNGKRRYKYLVFGRETSYFVVQHTDSKSKYTKNDIINMLEFLIDSIFIMFGGKMFQQTIGIPMGTNCTQ